MTSVLMPEYSGSTIGGQTVCSRTTYFFEEVVEFPRIIGIALVQLPPCQLQIPHHAFSAVDALREKQYGKEFLYTLLDSMSFPAIHSTKVIAEMTPHCERDHHGLYRKASAASKPDAPCTVTHIQPDTQIQRLLPRPWGGRPRLCPNRLPRGQIAARTSTT